MTLVLAALGRETIWLLADRRLSAAGRAPKDNGRKLMFLETTDATAVLGYAGLGATALKSEPSDWMSAVLRGRNLALEEALSALAKAAEAELPRHLKKVPGGYGAQHSIVIPAFVGSEARLYTIDVVLAANGGRDAIRYTRWRTPASVRPPRIVLAGSGAAHLRDSGWQRTLLRLVAAHDQGRISARAVADHLASLNERVAGADCAVGPRCIVAWRYRATGAKKGGGGHHFYTGTNPDTSNFALPTIARGMDLKALVEAIMPDTLKNLQAVLKGEPAQELDTVQLNAKLARIPNKPDERLR